MDKHKGGFNRCWLLLLALFALSGSSALAQAASDLAGTNRADDGRQAFERIKSLTGEWHAPEGSDGMVDIFRPIASGSAFVYEEWKGGKQLTSTVFYMVGAELRADHFCDLGNQLHYVVKPSPQGSVLTFELRDSTNLDIHPRHFHSSMWHFVDMNHLSQDWQILGGGKEPKTVHLDFTRQN